ncbi:twin-arginine translocation signal domain-containing protein [uncultured Massilia sp.]|uniref:twin-arginine translocation signal domain-containing protein n=1 Tax=uncultured Massilia sp. TaxID=169973 RepID=UPI00258F2482|nr:twin-arginine translocation signal domain-containing protein [uncultured Massilia sp.]
MGTSRRTFLKAGGIGALALAAGGALYRLRQDAAPHRFTLDGEARAALQAIAPAILLGALPPGAALEPTIDAVHAAILGLPPATQKEVQDLFGLLALAPARRLLTGVSGGWEGARIEEVSAFLQDWRLHRLGLLRSAYHALHDLVLGAWYAQESSWAAIGYPGPMKELS